MTCDLIICGLLFGLCLFGVTLCFNFGCVYLIWVGFVVCVVFDLLVFIVHVLVYLFAFVLLACCLMNLSSLLVFTLLVLSVVCTLVSGWWVLVYDYVLFEFGLCVCVLLV